MSRWSVGARPAATARSSIAGFMASMTTSISFFMPPSDMATVAEISRLPVTHRAPAVLPKDPKAGVFLALTPAAAEQEPQQAGDDHERERREQDREPAGDERGSLAVQRPIARGLGLEAPADAREQRRG